MRRRSEQWLAEQEVALLEAIYELESPPECDDQRHPVQFEAQRVRASKSRPAE